ncbi:hypothetical protein H1R20_g10758, partial [Candolleomyces eurysporus]
MANIQNPFHTWDSSSGWNPAPIAAPLPTVLGSQPTVLTYDYVNPNPDVLNVLNCMITDRNAVPQMEVTTYPTSGETSRTVFSRRGTVGEFASIDWANYACVEINGYVSRQPINQWLRLSADGRYRIMTVEGKEYMWYHCDGCFYLDLHNFAPSRSNPSLARVFPIPSSNAIRLELSTEAVQLQHAIVAAAILYSGRNFN